MRFKAMLFGSLCWLFLLSTFGFAEVLINEVMYDPGQCLGDTCEWVELYNPSNQTINLSACFFMNKVLTGDIYPNSYLLLVKDKKEFNAYFNTQENISEENIPELKFSLSNNGSKIKLNGTSDCNNTFDYTAYTDLADNNNRTLERNKKGEWKESIVLGGTPGRKNSVYDFSYDYSYLQITEIMADPFGKDDAQKPLGEWVELYNSGPAPIYLGGLVLYDNYDEHELKITSVNVNSLELCPGCYTVVYRDGDDDFELNNNLDDKVRLATGYPLTDSTIINEVSFTNSVEGMSWSRFPEGWYLTKPTPETPNVYTGGCDWNLDLEFNNSIFIGDDLTFIISISRIYGLPQNLTVKGKIEDLFGETVKEYSPWTNDEITTINSESYSPNLPEGFYRVSFWINDLKCEDLNLDNNHLTTLFAINPNYQKDKSSVEIETIYLGNDKTAEWGDQIAAKVNLYKGNENKYSAQLWIEKNGKKVSKTTKINIYDKYKLYPLTVPLQLEPNCNNEIPDGSVSLVLEAFGLRAEEKFDVEGVDPTICKDYLDYVKKSEKEQQKQQKLSYQIIDLPVSIPIGGVFKVKVQLNGDDEEHQFKVWSYLYRGNKCYSCDGEKAKEDNAVQFNLNPEELKQVDLLVKADSEIKAGEYKLKVKLNKDNQKTDQELTETIYLIEEMKSKSLNFSLAALSELESESPEMETEKELNPNFNKEKTSDGLSGLVIYESNAAKSKRLIPYFLIAALGFLCLVLIKKK